MRSVFGFLSVVVMMTLLSAGPVGAQTDIKTSALFNAADSASWTADGSWDIGVPGEGEIASIRSGVAEVTSAVDKVDAVSVRGGGVSVSEGGVLETDQLVVAGGASLSLSGNGTVKTNSFAVLGTLALDGGAGRVEANAAAFDAGSTIDVPSGSLTSFGQSIDFLVAESIASQQPNFTVGGAAPSLDRGLSLQLSGGSVTVGNVPVATVDRATGAVTVSNVAGGPMNVKGYSLMSGNGLLNPGSAASLGDGWASAASTADEITELNLMGAGTLNVGDSVSLGNAWGGTTVSPREEDVALSVVLDNGAILAGLVEYSGFANDLVLNVDPESGSATLQHMSASLGPLDLAGYSILSPSGSLNASAFSGIGGDFVNANPQDTGLGELNLSGSMMFDNGTMVDLGAIFTPGGEQDLVLQYGLVGSDRSARGTVEYGGSGGPAPCAPLNALAGDLDGDGSVGFPDFLALSANFGSSVNSYSDGDVDCDGTVGFPDFLALSANFGSSLGATAASTASVPEPSGVLLAFIGILGMLKFRKRSAYIAGLVIVGAVVAAPSETFAQDAIDTRFIRLHPEGPNAQINSTTELRGILDGTILDVIFNEDIAGEAITVDFGGGLGSFDNAQEPYLNGEEGTGMNDFGQYISGSVTIPEGEWTVGFGRDDGGWLRFTDIVFETTFNENGATIDGDGEILWNGTGGHQWTGGTFTVPDGGITTGIEAGFFERGGGDSWEIAYVDFHYDAEIDGDRNAFFADNAFELDTGEDNTGFGTWHFTGDGFSAGDPNDLNADGAINMDDYSLLLANWGNPHDFESFTAFATAFNSQGAAGAAAVPEPATLTMVLAGFAMLLSVRRRVRG